MLTMALGTAACALRADNQGESNAGVITFIVAEDVDSTPSINLTDISASVSLHSGSAEHCHPACGQWSIHVPTSREVQDDVLEAAGKICR